MQNPYAKVTKIDFLGAHVASEAELEALKSRTDSANDFHGGNPPGGRIGIQILENPLP